MSTKKVGVTGKHGVRGGVGIRKKYLLAVTDKNKKVCPKCGTADKIKRIATGIFQCQKCMTKISGAAYKFKSTGK
ncbi:MAG: transposase [archaeon]|jgi:large subunit ribosomal protein L37Ae